MSDAVITNAIARRDAARLEAQRWDDFIRMYGELTGSRPNMLSESAFPQRTASPSSSGALSDTEKATVAIISDLGRPLPTRDLLGLLKARGVDVGGKDPASTLSARLSRAPSLVNIRQRGWWIKGRADDDSPHKETSSALFSNPGEAPVASPSAPVEPGGEVAHDNKVGTYNW